MKKYFLFLSITLLTLVSQARSVYFCTNARSSYDSTAYINLTEPAVQVRTRLGTATVSGPIDVSKVELFGKNDFLVSGNMQAVGSVELRSVPSSYQTDYEYDYLSIDMILDGSYIPLNCKKRI